MLRNEKLAALLAFPKAVDAKLWPKIFRSLEGCHYQKDIAIGVLCALSDTFFGVESPVSASSHGAGSGSCG